MPEVAFVGRFSIDTTTNWDAAKNPIINEIPVILKLNSLSGFPTIPIAVLRDIPITEITIETITTSEVNNNDNNDSSMNYF